MNKTTFARRARNAVVVLVGLGVVGVIFGAGAARSELTDQGERIDHLEPRVESIDHTLGQQQTQIDAIQRDTSEIRKDVREIRDALLNKGRPK